MLTPCLRYTKIAQKDGEILVELCTMADNHYSSRKFFAVISLKGADEEFT